jgi:hypothetical protein
LGALLFCGDEVFEVLLAFFAEGADGAVEGFEAFGLGGILEFWVVHDFIDGAVYEIAISEVGEAFAEGFAEDFGLKLAA